MSRKSKKEILKKEFFSERKFQIFIFIFCFILYGNSIRNAYSLDDEYVTSTNEQVKQGIKVIPKIFTTRYTAGAGTKYYYGYRPIVKTTFAIEYSLFGENAHVSHFINILLYALIGVVLFHVLKKWLKHYNIVLPVLITLLFLAHPIHTEVVVSLKNRDELLSFLGCMLMLTFVTKYFDTGKLINILWGTVAFLLAHFSKPDALPFLAIIPLVAYYFTDAPLRKWIFVTLHFTFILAIFFFVVKMKLPVAGREMEYYENPLYYDKDFMLRLGISFYSLFTYLRLVIFPHPLVFYYGYNEIPYQDFLNIIPILSFLIFGALGIYALKTVRKKSLISFGILWFIICISMFSNLVTPAVGIVAERFTFASSLGFCIILAWLMLKFSKLNFESASQKLISNSTLLFSAGIILLLYSAKTISRNPDWKNQQTLFTHDIQYLENSVKANDITASHLLKESVKEKNTDVKRQMFNDALTYYKRTVEILPAFSAGYNNIGQMYANIFSDCPSAIPYFEKAIQNDTSFAEAMMNYGFCLAKVDKRDAAIQMLEKGLNLEKAKFVIPYMNLSKLYMDKGDTAKAMEKFDDAVTFFPQSEIPYDRMAKIYLKVHDTLTAIKYFEQGLKLKPNAILAGDISTYLLRHGDTLRAKQINRLGNR